MIKSLSKKFNKYLLGEVALLILIMSSFMISFGDDIELDLSNYVASSPPTHTCVWVSMKNKTQHWEECKICKNKRNVNNHNFAQTDITGNNPDSYVHSAANGNLIAYGHWSMGGYRTTVDMNTGVITYCNNGSRPPCWNGSQAWVSTCVDCGYQLVSSYAHTKGTTYTIKNYCHQWNCSKCNYPYLTEKHKDASGNILNCSKTGTCAICGYQVKANDHYHYGEIKANQPVKCDLCGKELFKVTNVNCVQEFGTDHKNTNTTVTFRVIPLISGMTMDNPFKLENDNGLLRNITSSITSGSGYWNLTYNFGVNTIMSYARLDLNSNSSYNTGLKINGDYIELDEMNIDAVHYSLLYSDGQGTIDTIMPNINSSDITTINGKQYINNLELKIDGKVAENLNSSTIQLVQKKSGQADKIRHSQQAFRKDSTDQNFSITFRPDIEFDANEQLYIRLTDTNAKVTEKAFTLPYYFDVMAPQFINGTKYNAPWVKERKINVKASDNGSGNVKIAINSNELKDTTKDGNNYSINYNVKGDIYTDINVKAYAKDALGNLSAQELIIGKIDNTNPNITNIGAQDNNGQYKVNVTSNDTKTGKGEGSGVTKYKIKRIN